MGKEKKRKEKEKEKVKKRGECKKKEREKNKYKVIRIKKKSVNKLDSNNSHHTRLLSYSIFSSLRSAVQSSNI